VHTAVLGSYSFKHPTWEVFVKQRLSDALSPAPRVPEAL